MFRQCSRQHISSFRHGLRPPYGLRPPHRLRPPRSPTAMVDPNAPWHSHQMADGRWRRCLGEVDSCVERGWMIPGIVPTVDASGASTGWTCTLCGSTARMLSYPWMVASHATSKMHLKALWWMFANNNPGALAVDLPPANGPPGYAYPPPIRSSTDGQAAYSSAPPTVGGVRSSTVGQAASSYQPGQAASSSARGPPPP